jgi:dTDP-4-dehydrorhamnose reductase
MGPRMKRLAVTGGCGYLGSALVQQAAAAGVEVVATWCTRHPPAGLPVDWRRVDVRDEARIDDVLCDVDAIVHTAYRQGGADEWSTNVEGSATVASAAARTRARLIHLSSDLVFDGTRGRYREEDTAAPVSAYGRAKAEAERRVADAHPHATVVRTSLIYGGDEPGPQERLARDGTRFFVDEIRSPVQVGDLAASILELLSIDAPGPLHLGGADDVSRYDFALLLGADPARIERAATTAERAPNVSLDSSRAARLLRTRLRGVREVLAGAEPDRRTRS